MSDLIFALDASLDEEPGTGFRVFADGRAETRDGDDGWVARWRYDAPGLREARSAIDTVAGDIGERYGEPGGVDRPVRHLARLAREDGSVREAIVYGPLDRHVPVLAALYRHLWAIRPAEQIETVWRLADEAPRVVVGEPTNVSALRDVLRILLERDGAAPAEAPDPLVVEVLWRIDGEDGEAIRLHASGRRERVRADGSSEPDGGLDAAHMDELAAALARVPWDAVSGPR